MSQLAVSISAEPVFHIGGFTVTNSILTSVVVAVLLISISIWAKIHVKRTQSPHGFQNFLEILIESLYRLTENITESTRKTNSLFPFVLSFFLFILLNNWIGLLPGVGTIGFREKTKMNESMTQQQQVAYIQTTDQVYAFDTATSTSSIHSTRTLDLLSIMTPTIISVLLITISFWASKHAQSIQSPKGLMSFLEVVVDFLKSLFSHNWIKKIFPIVIVFYFLLEISFFTGLVPGFGIVRTSTSSAPVKQKISTQKIPTQKSVQAPKPVTKKPESVFVPYLRAGTSDLNTTLALAIISVVATQIIGVQYLGIRYFKKFFNFSNPMNAFVGILELVSEIGHIISFAFRLFGNVFAGEVLLAVIYFLVPLFIPLPFTGLEIFVGTVQAFVFATLTLVFMNMATQGHDETHEEATA